MVAPLVQDTFPEYLANEGVSRGRIVAEIENSSKKAQYDAENDTEPTDAMKLGSAAHCAVLQPELFREEYTVFPGRRAGKEWTAFKADWADEDKILKVADYDYCLRLQLELNRSKKFQAAIEGCQFEASTYWDGKKARFDAYRPGMVLDLKTARSLTDHGIESALTVSNMIQIPHYIEAACAVEGIPCDWQAMESLDGLPSFIFAFVSKTLPIEVRLVEVPFAPVLEAAGHRHTAIQRILENKKRNSFPSYPDVIESFSPKPYIFQ